jgi:hypothetical protein
MLDTIYSAELGRGTVGYLGVNGQLYPVKSLSLHLTALWSPGSFSIPLSATETRHVELSAYAAELKVSYGLTELFDVGLVSFALSGSGPPQAEGSTYRAFVGVAPYWVWTGLFFSGGLNQGLLPRRAAAAGINGHGVIGGGPVAMLTSKQYQAELRAIWLRALVDPPTFIATNGKDYGLELDGLLTVELISWLSLSVEADLLIPGSYLPSSDVAYRAFALLRGSYDR